MLSQRVAKSTGSMIAIQVTIKLSLQFHIQGIPINDLFLKITIITSKAWSSSSETKNSIFNHRFASSYTVKEISEMIKMIAVTLRRLEVNIRLCNSLTFIRCVFLVVLIHQR